MDTSAFLAGFDPFSVSEKQVTTPKVQEEIRTNTMTWVRFKTAVENGKLRVRMPSKEFLRKAKTYAISVGDAFFLSETDTQVIALALELKASGYNSLIISDDYSIQNVATKTEIEFTPLATFGIRRLLEWIRYCPACRREYAADYESTTCTVCGTKLKRKPQKTARNFQSTS